MKKNDIINLKITDVNIEGTAISHFENMVVFIPNGALNDELEVKIIKLSKKYAVGKIQSIIKPSEDRIMPDCEHFQRCGGCSFRHINYDAELKIKHKHVSDCISRIGGFKNIKVDKIVESENINFYRNKSQMPVSKSDEIIAGFFSAYSHKVVDCSNCLLHPKEFNEIIKFIKIWIKNYNISVYDEKTLKGLIRHIYIRYAKETKEIMVCLVINGNNIPYKNEFVNMLLSLPFNIKSVVLNINRKNTNVILGEKNINLYGNGFIKDKLFDFDFKISPLSFYQINKTQTEKLYNIVKSFVGIDKKSTILDLYCGIGTIGISVCKNVKRVIAVEIVSQAIQDAKENAKNNKINNIDFICSDASQIVRKLEKEKEKIDTVIIDPPRKGCSLDLIEDILKINPQKIVYVSCNPATLARDLKIFCENSKYKIEKIVPVDMFPRTSHVETVVQLVRKKPDTYIDITVDMDELDLTSSEAKATYDEIKDYIFDTHRVKVSSLYIAQVKQMHGIIERDCYNNSKKESPKQPQCPTEKVKLIEEALRHFKMIP